MPEKLRRAEELKYLLNTVIVKKKYGILYNCKCTKMQTKDNLKKKKKKKNCFKKLNSF